MDVVTPANQVEPDVWRQAAHRELATLSARPTGWGYRKGSKPAVEPTALAGLGWLAATGPDHATSPNPEVRVAADWLVSIQNSDGSLGISAEQRSPGWPTPFALLLWNALGGYEAPRRRALAWLLRQKGRAIPKQGDPGHVVGHDTSLIGWPWVSDTHSWLEPTALSILALRREGQGHQGRALEGIRLVGDRALPDGGWNYGNKSAFGTPLRPQPAPTGLALLALVRTDTASEVIERAVRYLLEILPTTRSPAAIGWGLLGLRAWGHAPADGERWLFETYQRVAGRTDAATRLSMLLLAGGEASLDFLAARS